MTNPVLICGQPEYLNEAMPVLVDEHGNLHVNTAGTTVTGGTQLFASSLARTSNIEINLNDFQMALNPGDTLTLAAKVSSTTADISTSITWIEDI